MPGHPPPRAPAVFGRRALFAVAGAAALSAVAACSGLTPSAKTITVTSAAPPPAAPIMALIFKTRLHTGHLAAAAATDHPQRELFAALLVDREQHVAVLAAESERLTGETVAGTGAEDAVEIPDDPDEVTALIRSDAGAAQSMFSDAMVGASRYQAQLFATIAASVATHRAVLA